MAATRILAFCLTCEQPNVGVIVDVDYFGCVTRYIDCYNPECYTQVKYVTLGPTIISREVLSLLR